MIPAVNNALIQDIEYKSYGNKTYKLNTENNTITGKCDGIEAIKQTIYCILNTERFDYLIYSWNYGVEIKELIGEQADYVVAELKRVIKEALLQDDRIEDVTDFNFEINKRDIKVSFKVVTNIGDIEVDKVVSV